jgi:TRAP-type C4-dicarboxylate transport system permease large subunit
MKIFRANLPFFFVILAFTLALMATPGIATWLPSLMR